MRSYLCLVAVLVVVSDLSAAGTAAPRIVPGDEQDVLFFDEARPYRLRLHLQVKGRRFPTGWAETVDHLFRYLDVNGDGILSKEEASRAPSVAQWRQMRNGEVFPEPDPAPEFRELTGGAADGKLTRERVRAYYRRAGGGPLQVDWVEHPSFGFGNQRTAALFDHLDRNKDAQLSRAELLDAFEVLGRCDMNGDELISPDELAFGLATPAFRLRQTTGPGPGPRAFPFQLLHADDTGAAVAKILLARYDRNKDGKLHRGEFRIDRALFDRLDRNHDGTLTATELAAWRDLPPDLELVMPLEEASRELILAMGPDGRPLPLAPQAKKSREGAMLLPLGEIQLELSRAESSKAVMRAFRKGIASQLWALDANKNGFIESRELYLPPFRYVGMLRLADRNRDGKLSPAEVSAYLAMQQQVFATTTTLTVADRGRSLFELLDANHDGCLSQRELRGVWRRVSTWDRGHTGVIRRADIPRQFQLIVSHGRPRVVPTPQTPGSAPPGAGFVLPPLALPQGPRWFRKMDRNHDGDVSRSEFLGTDEQFRRIDADGDGLIDLDEAIRADGGLRKKGR